MLTCRVGIDGITVLRNVIQFAVDRHKACRVIVKMAAGHRHMAQHAVHLDHTCRVRIDHASRCGNMINAILDLYKTRLVHIQLAVRIMVQPAILHFKTTFCRSRLFRLFRLQSLQDPADAVFLILCRLCGILRRLCCRRKYDHSSCHDQNCFSDFLKHFPYPFVLFIDIRSKSVLSAFFPAGSAPWLQ